jgi:hypothetical protein
VGLHGAAARGVRATLVTPSAGDGSTYPPQDSSGPFGLITVGGFSSTLGSAYWINSFGRFAVPPLKASSLDSYVEPPMPAASFDAFSINPKFVSGLVTHSCTTLATAYECHASRWVAGFVTVPGSTNRLFRVVRVCRRPLRRLHGTAGRHRRDSVVTLFREADERG